MSSMVKITSEYDEIDRALSDVYDLLDQLLSPISLFH